MQHLRQKFCRWRTFGRIILQHASNHSHDRSDPLHSSNNIILRNISRKHRIQRNRLDGWKRREIYLSLLLSLSLHSLFIRGICIWASSSSVGVPRTSSLSRIDPTIDNAHKLLSVWLQRDKQGSSREDFHNDCDLLSIPIRTTTQWPNVNCSAVARGTHQQFRRSSHQTYLSCQPIKSRCNQRSTTMVLHAAFDAFAATEVTQLYLGVSRE